MLGAVVLMCIVFMVIKEGNAENCDIEAYLARTGYNLCEGEPSGILTVTHARRCDEVVPQEETASEPTISWSEAGQGETYTIAMLDPDAPHSGYWIHWILTGVTGQALQSGKLDGQEEVLVSYTPPTPPSGTHRYQFFVFISTGKRVHVSHHGRSSFPLDEFVRENKLCDPVGGFQYRVKSVHS